MARMKIGKTVDRTTGLAIEHLDLTGDPTSNAMWGPVPAGLKQLQRLHFAVQKDEPARISSLIRQNASRSRPNCAEQRLSLPPELDNNAGTIASEVQMFDG